MTTARILGQWRKASAKYRARHPGASSAWAKANPEKHRTKTARWRGQNREQSKRIQRRSNYRNLYGLSLEDVQSMIADQGGKCAICRCPLVLGGAAGAHVDHDHVTGTLRGMLCCNCNRGIGQFKDNPDFLDQAAAYLREGGQ